MSTANRWRVVLGLIGAACIGGLCSAQAGKVERAYVPGRLQVSSYAAMTPNGDLKKGVYVLDTHTGKIYHASDNAGFSHVDTLLIRDSVDPVL